LAAILDPEGRHIQAKVRKLQIKNAQLKAQLATAKAAITREAKGQPTAQSKPIEKDLVSFANTSIKQANILFRQGDFEGSTKMLVDVDQKCSGETRHLKYLGNSLMALSNYSEAEKNFRRWALVSPDSLEPFAKVADALAGQRRQIEAAETLEAYMSRTKPDSNLRRRIQTHRNLGGQPNQAVAKIRDEALAVKVLDPKLDEVQERILRDLKEAGIAMTSYHELFGGKGALWEDAEQEFLRFGTDKEVMALVDRISSATDFAQDPELAKLFKPSIVNYRNFFGDLSVNSPIAKLYYSERILGIANGYNEIASKIRNMHMWINPPLHPDNVNGRKGSQLWHRDQEDSRILKCFIYFSDIDEGSGATDFVKHTSVDCIGLKDQVIPYPATSGYPQEAMFNSRIPRDDFVRAIGPKGTIVFLDTNGFHRGGFVRDRARHIAMCTFLRPISPYVETNTKVAATLEELRSLPVPAAFAIA
jgi:tetratricopeptide (TPR) repeat protein